VTCIAGWVYDGTVWIGGDSAGVAGWDLTVRADQKVFVNGPMVFGFTSSFRMGQLLRYALQVPDHDPRVDDEKYMVTTFADAIRDCLKARGWAQKESEQERGGTFLVGYKGRLYTMHGDYQVASAADGFMACGCGDMIALGAMYASGHLRGRERVEVALRAAERFSAGVRGPFHILSLPAAAEVAA
jgi:ATP-dependent protease HslVU (ClpYQ) peptidase subunit